MSRIAKFFLILIAALIGWESWRVFGPEKSPPFWERESGVAGWLGRLRSGTLGARTFSDTSGRTVEAFILAANEESVRIRVVPNQTVHTFPLTRLSGPDQEFVKHWRDSPWNRAGMAPSPPAAWPAGYDGGNHVPLVEASSPSGSKRWQSARYEYTVHGNVPTATLQSLALISESIDGACRAAPLPLMWGRKQDARRKITIWPTRGQYEKAGGLPGSGGCFFLGSGEVYISADHLVEEDLAGQVRGFTLAKRQRYKVLVHELVHQASIGVSLAPVPAWVPEGIAEYFSATQLAPGRFQFRQSHVAVRNHAIASLGLEGVADLDRYPLWSLDKFMGRRLNEWNRIVEKNPEFHGGLQYLQAVLMVEFFCGSDSPEGNRFRSYLESTLSGADSEEAAKVHLLAGRSYSALEAAMTDYWQKRGMVLEFKANPPFPRDKVRMGVGIENGLGR